MNNNSEPRPENDIESNPSNNDMVSITTTTMINNMLDELYEMCYRFILSVCFLCQLYTFPIVMSYMLMKDYHNIECAYKENEPSYTGALQSALLMNNYILIVWYTGMMAFFNRHSPYADNSITRKLLRYVGNILSTVVVAEIVIMLYLAFILGNTNCRDSKPYGNRWLFYSNFSFSILVFVSYAEFGKEW